MAYTNKHKQLLQYFMRERCVPKATLQILSGSLFDDENIDLHIELINSKISPLEFKINKTLCDQNGEISYVFIASFNDDFNTKQDLNKVLFCKLVDYIIEEGGSVPYDKILTFNSNMTDTILDSFFSNKYLITDKEKNIFLSPLAISELEGYLAAKFADKTCMGCMKFVGHGIKCQFCKNYAHGLCLKEYFKNSLSQKCMKCSQHLSVDWSPIEITDISKIK